MSRNLLVAALGLSLIATNGSYVAEANAEPYRRPAPATQPDKSTPGKDFVPRVTDEPGRVPAITPAPVWPAAASAVVPLRGATAGTGTPMPVSISASAVPAKTPAAVQVSVLGQEDSGRLGIAGLAVRLARADNQPVPGRVRLRVDYSRFRHAFGGDWSTRLRLVEMDRQSVVPGGVNDAKVGAFTADVDVPASGSTRTFALEAGAAGPNGSYAATTLSPSSTWQVSHQTGDFTWNYPLRVPPGTAGPRPELSISYASGSLDGQTASTNNQPSWVGQGHTLEPGFIERKYVSCADDMAGGNNTTKTGDLCWKTDNATVSLTGHSSELLHDATKGWKLRNDDGSRIQRLTGAANGARDGEYWVLTTSDGTKYFFGLNPVAYSPARTNSVLTVPVFGNQTGEPCHAATFAASHCQQAWRWNLDRVEDRFGNVMTYRYVQETNYYGRNNNTGVSQYERASYLNRIEYAERDGSEETGVPPVWVAFGVDERCLPSGTITCAESQRTPANASHWPDVPVDQICTSSTTCPGKTSPTFFTTKRLTTVTTQMWTGAIRDVDRWTLVQTFEDPGDGTSKSLWLERLTHQGLVGGTITDPSVTFTGIQKPNRVDGYSGGAFPMNKVRISSITTESGARTTVNYLPAQCSSTSKPASAATNTMRCFPVYWTVEGGEAPTLHWFHKYVVGNVVEDDLVTDAPDMVTAYEYVGTPAWHFDDNELTLPKYRSWGDWRGYGTVNVRTGPPGSQTQKKYLYFRGMHDDRATPDGSERKTVIVHDSQGGAHYDYWRLNGYLREEILYNGSGGAEVSGTISTPWLYQTGIGGGVTSQLIGTKASRSRTRLIDGSYRVAGVDTDFDAFGMPVAVSDAGDVTVGNDDRCTRYVYNRNLDDWLTKLVIREETVSVSCDATPQRPAQVISDERSYYDYHIDFGTPPDKGRLTKVETMADWTTGPVYEQRSRTDYDALGRVVATYDGLNRKTSAVSFTPELDGPVTGVTTKDAKEFVSVTTVEPAWGTTLTEIDPNGKRTDLTYDPSGRLKAVWLPDRSKAGGATPSISHAYSITRTAPNVVSSYELKPNGSTKLTQMLFDGMLRKRQVQTPGANGTGRLIVDTKYDARGNVATDGGPYYESSSGPTTTLFDVPEQNLPAETVHHYDGADRETISVFEVLNTERWRTTTIYGGNATSVRPPNGATATTQVFDVRGNTTHLLQFHNGTTSGPHDTTTYTYTPRDELASVTNEAGSVWRYGYDPRGRQVSASDPDKGTTISTYDDADRLVSTRDARGQSLFYSYDELDRKTAVRSGSATGPVLANWTYDTLGKGLLTSSTRTVNGNSYVSAITGYDALDRPTGKTVTIPASEGKLAGTYATTTAYNPDGSVKSTGLPRVPGLPGETLGMFYDAAGNLDGVSGWTGYVADVIYSAYGEPLRNAMATEVGKYAWQMFTYEEGTRRLATMQIDRESQSSTDDIFQYTYDGAGNKYAITHTARGVGVDRQCYRVDHLRRLTDAWTPSDGTCTTGPSVTALGGPLPYWHSYAYSASGNRTRLVDHRASGDTTRTFAYPAPTAARPHAVTGVTSSGPAGTSADSYSYDAAGNLGSRTVGGDTETFSWDAEGHLASVSGQGGATSFVYDAEGSRLIKHDPAGATLYLDSTEVRWNRSTDTVSSTRYYSFNGDTVAMRTSATQAEFLMPDHHGTATVSVDASATTLSRRFMDPFGNTRAQSATWEPTSHGFVDGVIDSSTGLTHLGAREYDPKLGRFISVDALVDVGDPQTLNGYAYGHNNPTTFSDPSGLRDLVDLPDGRSVATGTPAETYRHAAQGKKERDAKRRHRAAHPREAAAEDAREEFDRTVSRHRDQKEQAKARVKRVIKDLVKIVADELGITDALNCFTKGDIGSCVSTGVNVLASFAGGVAGKLMAKYGAPWKWKKFAGLVGRIKGLVGEAVDGIKGWRKADGELRRLEKCNSFVPGTLVLLASGRSVPIEKLKLGDQVVATDPATGKTTAQPVVATITGTGPKHLVELTIRSGSVQTAKITATDGHPFYLPRTREWTDAGRLIPGDQLQSLNPKQATVVTSVRHYTALARVHNLTIAGVHTYYVVNHATASLVHNDQVCDLHGNSLDSPRSTALYRLETKSGDYLKTGITSNVKGRYSQTFMQDKNLIILTTGSRRTIAKLERFIVERDPGPLSRESWAGRHADDVPN